MESVVSRGFAASVQAVIHVIDNVFLPQILSVNATGNEVSIMVGNGQGSVQRFLIVYDNQVS